MSKQTTRRIFVDARSLILMRETDCERASALVAGNADIEALFQAIGKEPGGNRLSQAPGPGAGAMEFGKTFENMILADHAKDLLEPLGKIFNCTFIGGSTKNGGEVLTEPRSGESESEEFDPKDPKGRSAVWVRTANQIRERWTNHENGSIIIHGILRVPGVDHIWYLEPDLLVSPPGCPWYVPFEIKSYERNAFIENEHEIATAVVQSSIYLYCLIHGRDYDENTFPEQNEPRKDLRTGIIFRQNGGRIPDLMLASAQRDLHAISGILSDIPKDNASFKARFGLERELVRSGNLESLDHIKATYSDACFSGCSLATRCREQLRQEAALGAWGNALRDAYAGYETIGTLSNALTRAATQPLGEILDPDMRRWIDVEQEVDNLIARAAQ